VPQRPKKAGGYAESAARSSVTSKNKRAQSVVESSAWGGSDETGAESIKGDSQNQYIEMLRKTKKRNKVAPTLPSDWLPEARWEVITTVHGAAVPVTRASHCLVAAAPASGGIGAQNGYGATDLGSSQAFEHLYIVGGSSGSQSYGSSRSQSVLCKGPSREPKVAKVKSDVQQKEQDQQQQQQEQLQHEQQQQQQPSLRVPRLDQGLASFRLGPSMKSQQGLQAEWQPVRAGPPPRRLIGSAACAIGGGARIAVFGGIDAETGEVSRSLFVLDVDRGVWMDESDAEGGPPACTEHAATEVDGGRSMLVHGGKTSVAHDALPINEIRRLDIANGRTEWHQVAAKTGSTLESISDSVLARPPVRRGHTLCARGGVDGAPCVYMFGGYNGNNEVCADLTVLDMDRCIYLSVDSAGVPSVPRAFHTAVKLGPYMAVYGGFNALGQPMGDLKLLHLPTLMWAIPIVNAPLASLGAADERSGERGEGAAGADFRIARKKLGPTSKERSDNAGDGAGFEGPPNRSRHAAVPLSVGHKPGERAMLIFGGQVGDSCSSEILRLVLQLPKEREPGCSERQHPDKAYEFVIGNLESSMLSSRSNHDEQMQETAARTKSMLEDTRNMETRALSVKAQAAKFDIAKAQTQEEEDALLQQIEDEVLAFHALQKEARLKIRDLEMESESLLAKAQRLKSETTADFEGMLPEGELDFHSGNPVGKILNLLVPSGFIDRRDIRWRGARATAEAIILGNPREADSRAETPAGRRSTQPDSRSSTPTQGPTSRTTSPAPQSPIKRSLTFGTRTARGFALAFQEKQTSAELARWQEAARCELRVVAMLRHPCLQEIYGASTDESGIFLLTEPLMETLASRLSKERSGAPAGRRSSKLDKRSSTARFTSNVTDAPKPKRGSIESFGFAAAGWVLGEAQKLHMSCDLTAGLEYLHSKGVAHRHIVLENVYIRDQGNDVSAIVKLGGYFMARTSCRVHGEPAVPQAALQADIAELTQELAAVGLSGQAGARGAPVMATRSCTSDLASWRGPSCGTSPELGSFSRISPELSSAMDSEGERLNFKMGSFDARDLDIRSLGAVLLRLWLHQDVQAKKNQHLLDAYNTKNTEDLISAAEEMKQLFQATAGQISSVSSIRDASIRMVVTSCLRPINADQRSHSRPPSAAVLREAFGAIQVGDLTELPELTEDPSRSGLLADHAVDLQSDDEHG